MNFIVSPSLLSADFYDLKNEIKKVESIENSWLHIDVMDGKFVPQITFGSIITKQLKAHTRLPLDVHLMVINPEAQIQQFAEAGADYLTFHIEGNHFPLKIIKSIKSYGMKVGIALNPFTPIDSILGLLSSIDLLLIMSVEPGFSGQQFIPYTKQKILDVNKARKNKKLSFYISVDGGICEENALGILESGADVLVMGNYFFKNPVDKVKTFINTLRKTPS